MYSNSKRYRSQHHRKSPPFSVPSLFLPLCRHSQCYQFPVYHFGGMSCRCGRTYILSSTLFTQMITFCTWCSPPCVFSLDLTWRWSPTFSRKDFSFGWKDGIQRFALYKRDTVNGSCPFPTQVWVHWENKTKFEEDGQQNICIADKLILENVAQMHNNFLILKPQLRQTYHPVVNSSESLKPPYTAPSLKGSWPGEAATSRKERWTGSLTLARFLTQTH